MSEWKGTLDQTLRSSKSTTVLMSPLANQQHRVTTIDDGGRVVRYVIPQGELGDVMSQIGQHVGTPGSGSVLVASSGGSGGATTAAGTSGPGIGGPIGGPGPHGKPTEFPPLVIDVHAQVIQLVNVAHADEI